MSGANDKTLTLSVRDLVEFAARRGDLFFESAAGPTHLEGIAGHRQLQKSRGHGWQAEYTLKQSLDVEEYRVTLQGRVDLVNAEQQPVVIEEIKTTYLPPDRIAEPKLDLYWAQAKVYGYLYALQNPEIQTTGIDIRITLFNVLNRDEHTVNEIQTVEQLKAFTHDLLKIYLQWYTLILERRELVIETARALEFPHAVYRPGQYDFARQVYRTIRDRQQLLAQAPTGTGKTISTLFPAVKALGVEVVDQIVYLTAKTSAQINAEATLASLEQNGLKADCLTLTARDKMCPCRRKNADVFIGPDGRCRRTVGFYDRLPEARTECLKVTGLNAASITTIADRFELCPFALSLHMQPWASITICDFNYFFDPLVKLNTFESDAAKRALLIDEVHNLPDRARDMYSSSLSTEQMEALARHSGNNNRDVEKAANRIIRKLRALNGEAISKTTLETSSKTPSIDIIAPPLITAIEELIEALAATDSADPIGDLFDSAHDERQSWMRELFRFYILLRKYDESHRFLLQIEGDSVSLILRCLDATRYLKEALDNARATIGFSATLTPLPFYQRMLGFDNHAATLSLPPVFPPENLLVIRCDHIDTRWQHRNDSVDSLAELIATVYSVRAGKYLVFFPSYEYLNQVFERFVVAFDNIRAVKQQADDGIKERQDFLNLFFNSGEPTLGFAILGGVFAEGIDYAADALHGVMIIGTGMPQPTREQKLMQDYFSRLGLNGFQYAFQFPGFCRVLQTAGRVIRSEQDRGVVVLVDPRYQRPDYQRLAPLEWRPVGCRSITDVETRLRDFWIVVD